MYAQQLAKMPATPFRPPPLANGTVEAPTLPNASPLPGPTALFLSESIEGLNEGANFLSRLSADEQAAVRTLGRQRAFTAGESVFAQGDSARGNFHHRSRSRACVLRCAVRAGNHAGLLDTPGHFIGGPEITGGGIHMWSGEALEECRVTILPQPALQTLITRMPNFALCLIEGLVAKGKCYSAMAQMLGTRSVIERLAQFLVNLGDLYGVPDGDAVIINRKITHDQIAAMVGSTRQWVTMMLKRFKKEGILSVEARYIRIDRPARLAEILFKDGAEFFVDNQQDGLNGSPLLIERPQLMLVGAFPPWVATSSPSCSSSADTRVPTSACRTLKRMMVTTADQARVAPTPSS